ncbi:MAG TPA: phage Gp37/Gp68 family protein [Spirochaetota bacterium]|nr:phage Gp37/Gp68 family protein [Spirochaetota bacterium]
MKTKIEWATHTWNPVTGCTPISEGCEHCYAARMAKRLAGRCGYPQDDPFRPGTFHANRLNDPLKIKKSSMIFVCSMGDLFHEDVSELIIDEILDVIAACPQHVFIMLTKRPQNIEQKLYASTPKCGCRHLGGGDYMPNVWLGVTAENQARAEERIPILLSIPAAVRFVSVEPMLGPVDLNRAGAIWADMNGSIRPEYQQPCRTIDWVICGGETGPGARPMHPDWARSLRDQCKSASVPFFFKSMGDWWRNTHGYARCDKIQSRYLDGVEYGEYPEGVE